MDNQDMKMIHGNNMAFVDEFNPEQPEDYPSRFAKSNHSIVKI
ncbi:hypothetical protein [Streptococcus gallolyticus]|nr:hypothetical protein [Streptococcus gallolyticus]